MKGNLLLSVNLKSGGPNETRMPAVTGPPCAEQEQTYQDTDSGTSTGGLDCRRKEEAGNGEALFHPEDEVEPPLLSQNKYVYKYAADSGSGRIFGYVGSLLSGYGSYWKFILG